MPQRILYSDVLRYWEYNKLCRSLDRKIGENWRDTLPQTKEMGAFMLKMHQLGTLIWMAEHLRDKDPLVIIVPDPVPQAASSKGQSKFDKILSKLKQ